MAFADSGGGGSSIGSAIGSIAKKTAQTVAKKSSVKKSSGSGSTRRSSGNRSSGGSTSNPAGRSSYIGGGKSPTNNRGGKAPIGSTPTKSSIPDINAYLGMDSDYQNTLRGSKRTLNDYLSELGRRQGEAGTQFNDTKAGMERDRVQQLEDLKNEYASRGLINSGLYADEQGKFQQNYMTQLEALQKQQAALLADLMSQKTNFQREQELSNERARQEALQRRAAKYNIGG